MIGPLARDGAFPYPPRFPPPSAREKRRPMLTRLGARCEKSFRRWLPDPFVFALVLTLVAGATAVTWVGASPIQVVSAWYQGFWTLLEFGMQIVLVLTTGYAIALSAPASHLIDRLAARITRPGSVYLVVLFLGGPLVLVSWGWVVLTAVLARELAERVEGIDYPFLVACAYISSQAWVTGLSSSIPLLLNTPGNFLIEAGLLETTIPVSETLGSALNFSVMAVFLLGVPGLMWLVRPRDVRIRLVQMKRAGTHVDPPTVAEEADQLLSSERPPSDRLNTSALLQMTVAAMGVSYVVGHFATRGFDLDLDIMIFVFLMLGLLVHRTPLQYVVAMRRACSNVSGIVFQFPFYAGIMGIMMTTGLGTAIAEAMASAVSLAMMPLTAFVLGAVVNFAIPSAGGEWAVIGPPLLETLRALVGPAELEPQVARVALAAAYGESLTNLLQPFFLLTVLPVMGAGTRVQARDVVGYVFVPFVFLFVTIGALVTVVP